MVVCSPKDGFVVGISAAALSGLPVPAGEHLITLDTDDEARSVARIAKMEGIRQVMAAQYAGTELEASRRLAVITQEVAAAILRHKQALLTERQVQHKVGVVNATALSDAEAQHQQALLDHEKAAISVQQFDFATARHSNVNVLIETYMEQEKRHIDTKIARLNVLAPVRGIVVLNVGINSFAELGSVLLEVNEAK
jgi:hypothetical protein